MEPTQLGLTFTSMTPPPAPLSASDCRYCGLRIQWATTLRGRPIPMQPGQYPAGRVPEDQRWTFTRDRLHRAPWLRGRDQCRLVHFAVCPARDRPDDEVMGELWDLLWERVQRLHGGIREKAPATADPEEEE